MSGAYILSINGGTDADQKLKTGDIIVEINGMTVESIYDVSEALMPNMPGDIINITVYRDGQNVQTKVKLN